MSARSQDLGHGHTLRFTSWAPDDLPENRERYGTPLPKVRRAGALVEHDNLKMPGQRCLSGITFDLPETQKMGDRARWKVESWEPLTLSPSLLCRVCGDHGFIRDGRWVPA